MAAQCSILVRINFSIKKIVVIMHTPHRISAAHYELLSHVFYNDECVINFVADYKNSRIQFVSYICSVTETDLGAWCVT